LIIPILIFEESGISGPNIYLVIPGGGNFKHHPNTKWRLIFSTEMPKLYGIARRLLVMSTESVDVERVCKAHKVVHTKVRNRLNNKTHHELLYCYVNLRLIKKIQDEKDKKATPVDANGQWEDFFEAALIDGLEDEREQEQEEQGRENGSVASSDVRTTASSKLLDPLLFAFHQ
jgi:hypothetical protein